MSLVRFLRLVAAAVCPLTLRVTSVTLRQPIPWADAPSALKGRYWVLVEDCRHGSLRMPITISDKTGPEVLKTDCSCKTNRMLRVPLLLVGLRRTPLGLIMAFMARAFLKAVSVCKAPRSGPVGHVQGFRVSLPPPRA